MDGGVRWGWKDGWRGKVGVLVRCTQWHGEGVDECQVGRCG